MTDFARRTKPRSGKPEHRGKYLNTPTADLLLEIRGWLKVMGYQEPEELDTRRVMFIRRINETLELKE